MLRNRMVGLSMALTSEWMGEGVKDRYNNRVMRIIGWVIG